MNISLEKILAGFGIGAFLFICFQFSQIIKLKKEDKIKKFQISYMMGKYDSLYKRIDTLEANLFPCDVELSRFQQALELYYKKDPIAAKEFEDIKSFETE